jgi:carboxylesterase
LHEAIQTMHRSLGSIRVPVLLVNSRSDPTVPFSQAEQVRKLLVNAEVEQVILEKSGHVVTEDVEHEIVFDTAFRFIQKNN